MTRETSAIPTGLLFSVPEKITSSMRLPLSVLGLCSPSTHFTASEMLLLPLPFGPTTAVIPLLKSSTVLSTKDLKPCISNLFKYKFLSSAPGKYFNQSGFYNIFKELVNLAHHYLFR